MIQEILTTSKEETVKLGRDIASRVSAGTVMTLSGDLGAGKTTFTQGLLAGLGVEPPYTSPTFVIMKQYLLTETMHPTIHRVYHVDAYRIGTQELLSIGWEEWMEDPAGLIILEWPERVADIIPETAMNISLEWVDENRRKIVIENE